MGRTNQLRTVGALMMLILLACFNTVLSFVVDGYSEPLGWITFVIAAVVMFVALRYQQRLTMGMTIALFAIPFVIALLGIPLAM